MVLIIDGKRQQQCVSHELGRSARELNELARSDEGPVLVSRVDGLVTGMELRGPDARRPRDWALVGEFEVTDALSGEVTCASRLFHKQPRFFREIKPGLEAGHPVAFAYDFVVKWTNGALRTRIEFTRREVVDSVTAERRLSKIRRDRLSAFGISLFRQ
jgi:hypothetical protein